MFDRHLTAFAWSRALLSAGIRIAMSSAMMPMTTNSSTSVKPQRRCALNDMGCSCARPEVLRETAREMRILMRHRRRQFGLFPFPLYSVRGRAGNGFFGTEGPQRHEGATTATKKNHVTNGAFRRTW